MATGRASSRSRHGWWTRTRKSKVCVNDYSRSFRSRRGRSRSCSTGWHGKSTANSPEWKPSCWTTRGSERPGPASICRCPTRSLKRSSTTFAIAGPRRNGAMIPLAAEAVNPGLRHFVGELLEGRRGDREAVSTGDLQEFDQPSHRRLVGRDQILVHDRVWHHSPSIEQVLHRCLAQAGLGEQVCER